MDNQQPLIEFDAVEYVYPSGRNVLQEANFKLMPGEKAGLIGPNGSGKSTFLHLIMGLIKPARGTIRLFNRPAETETDFREARPKIGLLFQNADDQLFSPTVLEDVAFGPLNLGQAPAEAKGNALTTLENLDLKGFENRVTHRLSGGEKKLVALATVLVMGPEVLLLDEPTNGLDEETTVRIIEILNRLDISYLIVSHEYDFLARTTRNIYSMKDGRIQYSGDAAELHSHYHSHPAGSVPHAHSHAHKPHSEHQDS